MKHLFRMHARVWIFLALVITVTANAFAVPPGAPRNLAGQVTQDGSYNWLHLTWQRPNSDDVITHYALYRAAGADATTGFELVERIGGRDTIQGEFARYQYRASAGTYTYRVTAVNDDGEGAPSNAITIDIKALAAIRFVSTPEGIARVGSDYVYDADAVSSDDGAIRYELDVYGDSSGSATSVTIDESTGLVRMRPAYPGHVRLSIKATLVSDPRITMDQTWTVRVINCTEPNTGIIGSIRDDDGNAIESGYLLYNMIDATGRELHGGSIAFRDGAFSIDTLDAGRYVLRVTDGHFVSEWYADAYRSEDATPVSVTCGSITRADFTVTRREPIEYYHVSGIVTAASTGEPVPARLTFTGHERGVPAHLRWMRRQSFTYHTFDSAGLAGRFSVQLPNSHDWIVLAEHYVQRGSVGSDTLAPQYYDGANHPDAARVIYGDTEIRFALQRREQRANGFGGTLLDTRRNGVRGYVVAYAVKSMEKADEAAVSVDTDGNGGYRFENLVPGSYVVFAVPFDDGLAPGYYRTNDVATITWQEATIVTVGDAMLTMQHDVRLQGVTRGGTAKLHGMAGSMPPPGSRPRAGLQKLLPVTGANVAVVNSAGTIVGTAVTNRAGQFTVDNMPSGDLRLVIDKIGFRTWEQSISAPEGEAIGATAELDWVEGISSAPLSATSSILLRTYPNPAVDRLVLGFDAAQGTTALTLVDVAGNVVRSERITTVQGANRHSIDLDGLASGVYVVRLEGNGAQASASVAIVR